MDGSHMIVQTDTRKTVQKALQIKQANMSTVTN